MFDRSSNPRVAGSNPAGRMTRTRVEKPLRLRKPRYRSPACRNLSGYCERGLLGSSYRSPLRRNWIGVLPVLAALFVAGVTAEVVPADAMGIATVPGSATATVPEGTIATSTSATTDSVTTASTTIAPAPTATTAAATTETSPPATTGTTTVPAMSTPAVTPVGRVVAGGCLLVGGLALVRPGRLPRVFGPVTGVRARTLHAGSLVYPADGSIAEAKSVALQSTGCAGQGSRDGTAVLRSLSLFSGLVMATSVKLAVHQDKTASASSIEGLTVDGRPVTP